LARPEVQHEMAYRSSFTEDAHALLAAALDAFCERAAAIELEPTL